MEQRDGGIIAATQGSLTRTGGALGIAGCVIGIAIFLAACGGFDAALSLSILPLIMGGIAFVLGVVGPLTQKRVGVEDTHVLATLFVGLAAAVGGLIECWAWSNFPRSGR